MNPFAYRPAESVDDGSRQLAAATPGATRVLAGGTDLLQLMKTGIERPEMLIGVRGAPDMPRGICIEDDGVRLGALATLADLAGHAELAQWYPALAQAAAQAASPQLRNMATLGGTLLQRPRCWYFRDAAVQCWLKGGAECPARGGMNQNHAVFDTGICRAAHPSDVACALHALDARVELLGGEGRRYVPIAEFMRPPTEDRRHETVLHTDELVIAVHLPKSASLGCSAFVKAMDRNAWSFATVSVAARMQLAPDGVIRELRVVLGAVATVPWDISERMRTLCGERFEASRTSGALREAFDDADPLSMNAYKVPLARALGERALGELANAAANG